MGQHIYNLDEDMLLVPNLEHCRDREVIGGRVSSPFGLLRGGHWLFLLTCVLMDK